MLQAQPVLFTPLVDLLSQQDMEKVGLDPQEELLRGATVIRIMEGREMTWRYNVRLQTLPFALTGTPFEDHAEKLRTAQWATTGQLSRLAGVGDYLTLGDEMFVSSIALLWLLERWTETLGITPTYSAQTLREAIEMGERQASIPYVHDASEVH